MFSFTIEDELMKRLLLLTTLLALVGVVGVAGAETPENMRTDQLAAWCIVPFDASKRTPAQRTQMLKDLGISRSAYDWRKQHVQEFDEEFRLYKENGIELFAFWGSHDTAFKLFEKYGHTPQIWQMLKQPKAADQAGKVKEAADGIQWLAKRTGEFGLKLALYNHGGWSGEPENLAAVCEKLHDMGHKHVGIVYNWHHGHGHIDGWAAALKRMQPYLHCLNLNGMNTGAKPKILALAQGQHDRAMLKAVLDSGYTGPIGILDHQNHLDTKDALQDNLDGLDWLLKEAGEARLRRPATDTEGEAAQRRAEKEGSPPTPLPGPSGREGKNGSHLCQGRWRETATGLVCAEAGYTAAVNGVDPRWRLAPGLTQKAKDRKADHRRLRRGKHQLSLHRQGNLPGADPRLQGRGALAACQRSDVWLRRRLDRRRRQLSRRASGLVDGDVGRRQRA
jgi:sugar phosphate isomerase/epimerase